MKNKEIHINDVLRLVDPTDVAKSLENIANNFCDGVVFSNSFSAEDQLITHLIFSNKIPIQVFTLDTGRLFAETYTTWSTTLKKYNQTIIPYYPNEKKLQSFVEKNGPNSFYTSIENRKMCCNIRKVEPLKRALARKKIWVTGIRNEHSIERGEKPIVEYDEINDIYKYHPLLYWSYQDVFDCINKFSIPYNPLHDKGFVSIGCMPCTRPIQQGEDFRAGRWWWEDNHKKECGLHLTIKQ